MLCVIVGSKGSGKTALMTSFAHMYHSKTDKKIISNYDLSSIDENYAQFSYDILFDDKLHNSVLLLDEIYLYSDSRVSMSAKNRQLSYMLYQSRKTDVDIYATMISFMTLDKRFREQVDLLILCEKTYMFKYTFITKTSRKKIYITFEQMSKIFDMYDTFEIIQNDTIQMFKAQNLSSESIQSLVERNLKRFSEYLDEYNQKKATNEFIKFFLMKENLPVTSEIVNCFKYTWEGKKNEYN